MADVDAMLVELSERDVKVAFSDLEKRKAYPIKRIRKTSTQYLGRTIFGTSVNIDVNEVGVFTYLPKIYINMKDTLVNMINEAATTEKPFTVVYYGTIGTMNFGKVHKHGEGLDQALIAKIDRASGLAWPAAKRKAEDGEGTSGSSAKKPC